MRAICIAALLAATPAFADDKGVIWADATGGYGAKEPKQKEVIWADATGGSGAKAPKEREVIWADTTDGDGITTKRASE